MKTSFLSNSDSVHLAVSTSSVPDGVHRAEGGENVPSAWIPVSERMPDREERVLVYGAKLLKWAVAEWDERNGWQVETCSEFHSIYTPTHWMPLPAPPASGADTQA